MKTLQIKFKAKKKKKKKNAIQIAISGSEAAYSSSWWLRCDIHQVALIVRMQIFGCKPGSSSWRGSFRRDGGCFRMRAREIKTGENESNNLGSLLVLIHRVGWRWQGICCLNPSTVRRSGRAMNPHDNRTLNWRRHAALAHITTPPPPIKKNKTKNKRLIKVGSLKISLLPVSLYQPYPYLHMNLPWCWKMIEMLYIDIEQQPVDNECSWKCCEKK